MSVRNIITGLVNKIGDLTGNGITETNLALAVKNDRSSLASIPSQTYITEKEKTVDVDSKFAIRDVQIVSNNISIATQNARIDNLIVNPGNGTVPPELIDTRVDNFGFTHKTSENRILSMEKVYKSGLTDIVFNWVQGSFNSTTGAEQVSGNGIRTDYISAHDMGKLTITPSTNYVCAIYKYDSSKAYVSHSGNITTSNEYDTVTSGYYRIVMYKSDYSLIDISVCSNITFSVTRSSDVINGINSTIATIGNDTYGFVYPIINDRIDNIERTLKSEPIELNYKWEVGGINASGVDTTATNRLRTPMHVTHDGGVLILEPLNGFSVSVLQYDDTLTYKQVLTYSTKVTPQLLYNNYRLVLVPNPDRTLTIADVSNLNVTVNRNSSTTTFKGKKIVTYGDSITQQGGWQDYIAKALDCTMINCGVGGSLLADPFNDLHGGLNDSMCDDVRVNQIPTDTDIIIAMIGANDGGYSPLGSITSPLNLERTNYTGAFTIMVQKIQARCPNAILFIASTVSGQGNTIAQNETDFHYFTSTGFENMSLYDYAMKTKELASRFSLPYIPIYESLGCNPFNRSQFVVDTIHRNDLGKKRIANVMIGNLLNYYNN